MAVFIKHKAENDFRRKLTSFNLESNNIVGTKQSSKLQWFLKCVFYDTIINIKELNLYIYLYEGLHNNKVWEPLL